MYDPDQYQKDCERTESMPTQDMRSRAWQVGHVLHDWIHESANQSLFDVVKRFVFYNKMPDDANAYNQLEEFIDTGNKISDETARRMTFQQNHDERELRILHCWLGLMSEMVEFSQAIIELLSAYKSKNEERIAKALLNLKEEFGDQDWYQSLGCNATGLSFGDIIESNIRKLKKRYPNKFSEEKAANRDLEAELVALEMESSGNGDITIDAIQKTDVEIENFDVELVKKALASGWVIGNEASGHFNAIYYPNDRSNSWAAAWRYVVIDGRQIEVPHWLERRMEEIKVETRPIQRDSSEDTSIRCKKCGLKIHRNREELGLCPSCQNS